MDRSEGRCEVEINGTRCSNPADAVHHVLSRAQGGKDTLEDVIAICNYHHDIIHNKLYKHKELRKYKITRRNK